MVTRLHDPSTLRGGEREKWWRWLSVTVIKRSLERDLLLLSFACPCHHEGAECIHVGQPFEPSIHPLATLSRSHHRSTLYAQSIHASTDQDSANPPLLLGGISGDQHWSPQTCRYQDSMNRGDQISTWEGVLNAPINGRGKEHEREGQPYPTTLGGESNNAQGGIIHQNLQSTTRLLRPDLAFHPQRPFESCAECN